MIWRIPAICVGFVIAAIGLVGVVEPRLLESAVGYFQTPPMVFVAGGVRVIMGAILFGAASHSRTPGALAVLGIVLVVGGILTPVIGASMGRTILDLWATFGPGFVRAWGALATALGAFIVYSLTSKRR